jgi:oxygen-independent coproporphyrinogen-3 oxidase
MAGIYLHIPFCARRCVYCDFYFVTTARSHAGFVAAMRREIAHYGAEFADREPIETIYFGGGTPSRLGADDVGLLIDTVREHFRADEVAEITLELNPDDADPAYLLALRGQGVDRLSIGIQSFYAADLAFMNRSHGEDQARAVVDVAREAGFENLSIDLIFGLPDQPEEYWAANLERAVRLDVPHLSTYSLTVESGTVLHNRIERGLAEAPDEDLVADRYAFTRDFLARAGYEHYEISSFARPGFRSVHNSRYWNHHNYLGFGPSAHSFWWRGLPAVRWANVRNLRQYEALVAERQPPIDFRESLSLDTLADEYVMLSLRTSDGIDLDRLEERYGTDLLLERLDAIAWLESEGLIHPVRNRRIRLTDQGRIVCDSVTARLLPDPSSD